MIREENKRRKYSILHVVLLYAVIVCIGIIYCSHFTIPVHSKVDGEMYLSMAKSFHDGKGFMQYGKTLNYRSILYSMILSLCYFFYTPEHIMFYVRIANVLMMGSMVFPISLLAREIFGEMAGQEIAGDLAKASGNDHLSDIRAYASKRAFQLTCMLAIIPEMAMAAYVMQESLYYPLLTWAFYCMYMDLTDKSGRVNKWTVLTPVLFMLAFMSKTVGFIYPALYCGMNIVWGIISNKSSSDCRLSESDRGESSSDAKLSESNCERALSDYQVSGKHEIAMEIDCQVTNRKSFLAKAFVQVIVCGVLFMLETLFMNAVSIGDGTNHYSDQFSWLFPITWVTVRCIVVGIVFYIIYTIISMGAFPVVMPFINRGRYSDRQRRFMQMIYIFLAVTVLEIVICILCTEEKGFLYPSKYYFRYLFPLFIPLFILMEALPKDTFANIKAVISAAGVSACGLFIYYVIAGTTTRSGIVDSFLFTLLTNVTNNVWKYAGVAFSIFLILLVMAFAWIQKKQLLSRRGITCLFLLYFVLFDILNLFQLPYYNNVICDGKTRQEQFIEVGRFLKEHDHDSLVYVAEDYLPQYSLWGYIDEDYHMITNEDLMGNVTPDDYQADVWVVEKDMLEKYTFTGDTLLDTGYLIVLAK